MATHISLAKAGHKVFFEFRREGCVIFPPGGTLEEVKPEYLVTRNLPQFTTPFSDFLLFSG